MAEKRESEIASYIFGIISIVMAFFQPIAGIVFSIVGLIQSKKEKTELSRRAKKLNIIGLILSIVLFIVLIVVSYYFNKTLGAQLQNFPIK